jgi:hypothetical protein
MLKKIKENVKYSNLSTIYVALCIIILGFLCYYWYHYYSGQGSLLQKYVIENTKYETLHREYWLIDEYYISNKKLFKKIFEENKGYVLRKLNKGKEINKIIDKELKKVLEDGIDTCYKIKSEKYKIHCDTIPPLDNIIRSAGYLMIKDNDIKDYIKKYNNEIGYKIIKKSQVIIKIKHKEITLSSNKNIERDNFLDKLTIEDLLESTNVMKIYHELINKQCVLDTSDIQYKKVIEICKNLEELEDKIHKENRIEHIYEIFLFSISIILIVIIWCWLIKELNKLILNSTFNYLLTYLVNLPIIASILLLLHEFLLLIVNYKLGFNIEFTYLIVIGVVFSILEFKNKALWIKLK